VIQVDLMKLEWETVHSKEEDVTILLLSVYATGNDRRLLRMRILFSCTNR